MRQDARKRKRQRSKRRGCRTMQPGERLNVTFTLPVGWDDAAMLRWFCGKGIEYTINSHETLLTTAEKVAKMDDVGKFPISASQT